MTATVPGAQELRRPDGSPLRLLVADDEPALTGLLSGALRREGWEVRTAAGGASAVRAAREYGPDALVLDLALPDLGGVQVMHLARAAHPELPVLFLAPRDDLEERIAGLAAGGDDCLVKPFAVEELVARLRSLLRRSAPAVPNAEPLLVVGDLTLDEGSHEVHRGGSPVRLTNTEFELLRFLMHNQRRVLSKAQILDRVWSADFGGRPNIVELYISYLRRKIDAGRRPMIHTLRGAGYVLKPAG